MRTIPPPILRLLPAAWSLVRFRQRLPEALHSASLDTLLSHHCPWAPTTYGVSRLPALVLRGAEAIAARLPRSPNTCFYRSLARYAFFQDLGIDAAFVLGLPISGEGNGHAWVEVSGIPYGETPRADLVVTFRFPSAPHAGTTRP